MTNIANPQRTQFSLPGKTSEAKEALFDKKKERLVTLPPPEQSLSPSPMDLTTLQNVKDFLGITNDSADDFLQGLITANGYFWLEYCSLGNQNQVNTQSPLNSVCTFNETYDGNGSFRFYLRNRPIISIVQLQINGVTITPVTQYGQAGVVIDGDAKSLAIVRGGSGTAPSFTFAGWPWGGGNGQYFQKGIQNINVQYTAGYAVTPFDVELASKQTVALTYQQRDRLDVASQAMAYGAGTVSFRAFAIPPLALATMNNYRRVSMY
jgi:hypothetical protein